MEDPNIEKQLLYQYAPAKDEISSSKKLIKEYIQLAKKRGFIEWNQVNYALQGADCSQFIASLFNPINALFLTLMVNARHLFYGISMLDKYKGIGKKKMLLSIAGGTIVYMILVQLVF